MFLANLGRSGFSLAQEAMAPLLAFILTCSPLPAAEFEILDGDAPGYKLITVSGEIQEGDDEVFYKLANQAERAVILLESPGGSVDVGLSIGSEIAIRGFSTIVLDGDGCHSICAVIWVSGAARYMSPDAEISVHAAYSLVDEASGSLEALPSGVGNAMIGAYLNEIGLSARAIKYFTISNPDQPLLPITPDIAQALDIDIFVQDGSSFSTPTDRPTPRRITRQVTEFLGMAANCSAVFGVAAGYWKENGEGILRQGHETFGGEVFAELISEFVEIQKQKLYEMGTIRWCLNAEANLREDRFDTGIPGPSFDCNLASTLTENTICNSRDLWSLDRAMANVYFYYRAETSDEISVAFLDSQRLWLKRRNECGDDVACLAERYTSRLFDFGY